jgi:ArsR family transcriptional regulator
VCELQSELDAAQSRLSFHLRVLKDAGFLIDRKEGRWVYYSLDPDIFAEAKALSDDLKPARRSVTRNARVCCD